jgi:hypothetical protein
MIDNNLASSRGGIRTLDLTIMNRRNAPGKAVLHSKITPSILHRNTLIFTSHSAKHSAKISSRFYSHTGVAVSRGGSCA